MLHSPGGSLYFDNEAPISLLFGDQRSWKFFPRSTIDEILNYPSGASWYSLSVDRLSLDYGADARCPMMLGEWAYTISDGYQRTITECMDGVPPTQKPTLEELFDRSQCCKRIKVTQFAVTGADTWDTEGICTHTETFDPSEFNFKHDPWTTPKYGYDCEGFEGGNALTPRSITWRSISHPLYTTIYWALDELTTAADRIKCSGFAPETRPAECNSHSGQTLAFSSDFKDTDLCPIIPTSNVVWPSTGNAGSGKLRYWARIFAHF